MQRPPAIFLIGLRASGKTTVAKGVAQALSGAFIDLDIATARELGCASAGEALQTKGEPEFRRAELVALERVIQEQPDASGTNPRRVIALGGGTAMIDRARVLLARELEARRAVIVYLRATPITLRRRLATSNLAERPSLTGAGVLEEVASVFAARDGIYRALATHTIDIDDMNEPATISAVLGLLNHTRDAR